MCFSGSPVCPAAAVYPSSVLHTRGTLQYVGDQQPPPHNHLGLTGVMTDVADRLHTAEALHPVFAAQSEAGKETRGWDRLPPTTHCVILAESATTRTSIPTSPPPTIHRFLNARNTTALHADCHLTYTCNSIYLPTFF